MKSIVGSRQHDEDFQSAENHTDHLHDQSRIVGGRPRQPNGQAHRAQSRSKFKHGLFQTAPGGQGEEQRSGDKQEKLAAHEANGIGTEFLVNFGSPLCFHEGWRIHTPLGQQLPFHIQTDHPQNQIAPGQL